VGGTFYPPLHPAMEIYVKFALYFKINVAVETEIFDNWNFVVEPCHLSIAVPPQEWPLMLIE
jgi:hypothetical protein